MVRVFQETSEDSAAIPLWLFSYIDWQGKKQVSVGTESRVETQRLAERVQAEHDLLRKEMRPRVEAAVPVAPPVAEPDEYGASPEAFESESALPEVVNGTPPPAALSQHRGRHAVHSPHSVRVGDQLVETNVISRAQLDEGLEYQRKYGGRIIDVLIQLGHLTAEAFLVFMGNRPGIPRVELGNYTWLSKEVLQLITPEMATELEAIPIDRLGKTISVAMVCPVDLDALERIQEHTGLKIRPLLCSRPEFRAALRIHYGTDPAGARAVRK